MRRFLFISFLCLFLIAACGPSPKAKAKQYAERMPDEVGEFSKEDNRIELTAEAIGNTGHVTLHYTERNAGDIYLVIDTYGTVAAANVAYARRERDLRLLGYAFEANRAPRQLTAQIVELPQGRLAVFQNDEVIIEVQYIKADPETEFDETSWEAFLDAVRQANNAVEGIE